MTRQLLVVDGYNVIRACAKYRDLIDDDYADPVLHDVYVRARQALVSDVAAYAHGAFSATVVFDGFGNPDPERPPRKSGGVDIVFSPSGVEADSIIERMVRRERDAGRPVTVITSDSNVQSTVYGPGVTRLSARMFDEESASYERAMQTMRFSPNDRGRMRATVAERIPEDVRIRLHEMSMPQNSRPKTR